MDLHQVTRRNPVFGQEHCSQARAWFQKFKYFLDTQIFKNQNGNLNKLGLKNKLFDDCWRYLTSPRLLEEVTPNWFKFNSRRSTHFESIQLQNEVNTFVVNLEVIQNILVSLVPSQVVQSWQT